jgi:uncharacterized protein (TIGR03437 family)
MNSRLFLPFIVLQAALAQPLSYTQLSTSTPPPSPRVDGAIAYDPSTRRLYLFGGRDSTFRNDLWFYSLAERRWQEVESAGPKPPARLGHTLAYDPVRRRLILFGGQASGFFSDVWAFDTARQVWTQLAPSQSGPSNRYGHSMIYDPPRDRIVVSHGFTNAGRFDDTWAFDLSTNRWRDISPSGPRPLRRCLHHAVHDPVNGRMLLYGGCASPSGPCPLGDLWAFDLDTHRWRELTTAQNPPPREHYGRAYDAVRNRFLIFGGSGQGLLNDTWTYDSASATWSPALLEGPAPSPRSRHESAYDSVRNTIFFFGGQTSAGLSNELWMLGPGFLPARPSIATGGVANAFSHDAAAISPGELVSIYGSNLGAMVTFNGVPAPVLFESPGQLNVQVPYEIAGAAEATLIVANNGQSSDPVTLPLRPTHAGLYPAAFQDGDIAVFFATGHGLTSPPSATGQPAAAPYPAPAAPLTLTIAGQPAEILFQGQAPGTFGVLQINARIPPGASGQAVPVTLSIGDSVSTIRANLSAPLN